MQIITIFIGICAVALLMYYVYILVKGDAQ